MAEFREKIITAASLDATDRAILSGGASEKAIYEMVAAAIGAANGGTLLDVGCGSGQLWQFVRTGFSRYVGADLVHYDRFPAEGEFVTSNLDRLPLPLPAGCAEVVAAVETIEHLENPRAFMRELVRLAKKGGRVAVTTPNQLSALSKLTLIVKNRFNAFQDTQYPAHITALLECDLIRIAAEAGLKDLAISYSRSGRVFFTAAHYPRRLAGAFPRACSDNLCIVGTKLS